MNAIKIASAAMAVALFSGAASAHDCRARIGEIERLLDAVSEEAISTSSGGQAVAGARQAQAIEGGDGGLEEPAIQVQEEPGRRSRSSRPRRPAAAASASSRPGPRCRRRARWPRTVTSRPASRRSTT